MRMKLIATSLFLCALSAYGQEIIEKRTPSSPSELHQTNTTERSTNVVTQEKTVNKPVTISKRAGEPQVVHDAQYYQEEINKVNQHIDAIDQKVAYVKADPIRKAQAESENWFEQMELIKEELEAKKASLEVEYNNL